MIYSKIEYVIVKDLLREPDPRYGQKGGDLFAGQPCVAEPFRTQLLKWIGNKQRVAHRIVSFFPPDFKTYFEPFLGSGAVLGTLAPKRAFVSDVLEPLMEIWHTLAAQPEMLTGWYRARREKYEDDAQGTYEAVRERFNQKPNPADLFFLSRTCYGGVIRFRKDGFMSTPKGVHQPISTESLAERVAIWHERTAGATFQQCDFEQAMDRARAGDLIYCDPPYADSQSILYGAQAFSLDRLFEAIASAKRRGVFVAVSLDGQKKSGKKVCDVAVPGGLFRRLVFINCGRSMLRRFQMRGGTLEGEVVADRLFLTY